MKWVSHGTDECFISQSPRSCLKTHEDAIVACTSKVGNTLCYIPSENTWYKLKALLSKGEKCHGMSTCHGKLYIVGGPNLDGRMTAECYIPFADSWISAMAPERVRNFASVVTFQGFVYVIGGANRSRMKLDTVERYNPDTNKWTQMPSLSSPRSSVCSVADGNHLYSIGGNTGYGFLDIAERFDPDKNCWSRIASTCTKRGGACGAAVNGKVFVIGGCDDAHFALRSCEVYDINTDKWMIISSLCKLRFLASAVSFKGRVVVFGGKFARGCWEKSFEIYDIEKNEWRACTNLPDGAEQYKISTIRLPRKSLVHPIPQPTDDNPVSSFVW